MLFAYWLGMVRGPPLEYWGGGDWSFLEINILGEKWVK